jgi:DNA/RNA endonuclease YhcR with UshA esterase domain
VKMQKEEQIVVVLLFMALASLTVASWALGDFDQIAATPQKVLEGTIISVQPTKTGGHLIIHLDSTSMPVFVDQLNGAEDVKRKVQEGDRVVVKGEISEYKGQPEMVIKRADDVEVLS